MLVIDGSHGEGGGQVLRTSLALAAIAGRPVRIEGIRAGRREPGLRPQHLTAVRAAAAVCQARVEGAEIGSQTLTFAPGSAPTPGEYVFDVEQAARGGSAGSVVLVLQTVLWPLALADGESFLTLRGGTHVPWAPSASYLEHVLLPTFARMGVSVQMELVRWGFYPAGGGEVRVSILGRGQRPDPIELIKRGALQRVWGLAVAMNLPAHIPQRMAARASNVLAQARIEAWVEPLRLHGAGPGAGVFLFSEYEHARAGFSTHGDKGLPSERVAEMACQELMLHDGTDAPADPYLADQLVLPMALAVGESRLATSRVSEHLLTNLWAVREFLAVEMQLSEQSGGRGILVVRGGVA